MDRSLLTDLVGKSFTLHLTDNSVYVLRKEGLDTRNPANYKFVAYDQTYASLEFLEHNETRTMYIPLARTIWRC